MITLKLLYAFLHIVSKVSGDGNSAIVNCIQLFLYFWCIFMTLTLLKWTIIHFVQFIYRCIIQLSTHRKTVVSLKLFYSFLHKRAIIIGDGNTTKPNCIKLLFIFANAAVSVTLLVTLRSFF